MSIATNGSLTPEESVVSVATADSQREAGNAAKVDDVAKFEGSGRAGASIQEVDNFTD
jgi:hypothetical protein